MQRAGDGAGEGVGIDVVGLPVDARRHGRHHRDQVFLGDHVEHGRIHHLGLADEAEIDHLLHLAVGIAHGARRLLDGDEIAVLAAEADGPAALGVERRNDLLVDGAGQHHLDDFHGGAVGDAQAVLELALDAELVEHGADLRAAAVDDDRLHAGLLQEHDVAGEGAGETGVTHGMAAVLHHDRLVVVALHVGQRFRDDAGARQHRFGGFGRGRCHGGLASVGSRTPIADRGARLNGGSAGGKVQAASLPPLRRRRAASKSRP